MVKARVPIQSSPELLKRLKALQQKLMKEGVMKNGKFISIRDLTEEIANSDTIEKIEAKLLKKRVSEDIKLNFDRRKK